MWAPPMPWPTWQKDKWHQSTRESCPRSTLSPAWPPCLPEPLVHWHASLSPASPPTPADGSHRHRRRRAGAGHATRVAALRFRVSESSRPPHPSHPPSRSGRIRPAVWFSRSCSGFRGGIRSRGRRLRRRVSRACVLSGAAGQVLDSSPCSERGVRGAILGPPRGSGCSSGEPPLDWRVFLPS
jgi:hypothetical protein